MKDFFMKCDICKSLVIDRIENYDKYTRSVIYKESDKFKIHFYCPGCIKKFNIKVDFQNTEDFCYYE